MRVRSSTSLFMLVAMISACGDDESAGTGGSSTSSSSTSTSSSSSSASSGSTAETSSGQGGDSSSGGANQGGTSGVGGQGGDPSTGGAGPGGGTSTGGAGGGEPLDAWIHHFVGAGANTEDAAGAAPHPAGGVVVAGTFRQSLGNTGIQDLTASGFDAFVARLDDDGVVLWAVALGSPSARAADVDVDENGDVYLVARTQGDFTFGSSTIDGDTLDDPIVAKLSADGTPLWATLVGGPGNAEVAQGFGLGPGGEPILVATFVGTTSVGGFDLDPLSTNASYVAALDPSSGGITWVAPVDSDGGEAYALDATSSDGAVVVAGHFTGDLVLDGATSESSAGLHDGFLAAFSIADGTPSGSVAYGSAGEEFLNKVVGSGTDLVVAGSLQAGGEVDLGGGPLTAVGGADIFLAAIDTASGGVSWQHRFGEGASQYANSVGVDDVGRVVIAGFFTGTVDFGGGSLTETSDFDQNGFFARFDVDGSHLESWSLDGQFTSATGAASGARLFGIGTIAGTASVAGLDDTTSGLADQDVLVIGFPPLPF